MRNNQYAALKNSVDSRTRDRNRFDDTGSISHARKIAHAQASQPVAQICDNTGIPNGWIEQNERLSKLALLTLERVVKC